jgi:hypothetical protein
MNVACLGDTSESKEASEDEGKALSGEERHFGVLGLMIYQRYQGR